MFGIDQISWTRFWEFILFVLAIWYLGLLLWSWYQKEKSSQKQLFVEHASGALMAEATTPFSVCSRDYPSGLIPIRLSEDIPLPVSLYEEAGIDDGYPIDCFTRTSHPEMSKILEQVQFQ
ncbi:hypothetical protein [Sunxiuqinia indica]|uniref:hypothetical protein n=1 Tax=Sunxiuqinia indica TaxID=2692584 RepID=UPI00135B2EF9|nr:hypothetical protein [Sunxiuqinia indica]